MQRSARRHAHGIALSADTATPAVPRCWHHITWATHWTMRCAARKIIDESDIESNESLFLHKRKLAEHARMCMHTCVYARVCTRVNQGRAAYSVMHGSAGCSSCTCFALMQHRAQAVMIDCSNKGCKQRGRCSWCVCTTTHAVNNQMRVEVWRCGGVRVRVRVRVRAYP